MIPRNSASEIQWHDDAVAEQEAGRIFVECQLHFQNAADRARAREQIRLACAEYHYNEQRKREPLRRQVMRQAKILLEAIATLQTVLPGSEWEQQQRSETLAAHLPAGRKKPATGSRLLTRDKDYNNEMIGHWRPSLRVASGQRAEAIGGYSFCPPTKFRMGDAEYTDWQGAEWAEHMAQQLDNLSAMVREHYRRTDKRRALLSSDKTKTDPLRSGKPREQMTRVELADRENISIKNLLVALEFFWLSLHTHYAPLSRIDEPAYQAKLKAGKDISEGQRFMRLILLVCRSVGIGAGLDDKALFKRAYDLRKATKMGRSGPSYRKRRAPRQP